MQRSSERFLTTHTGSLPRPQALIDIVLAKEKDAAIDSAAFEAETEKAVHDVVSEVLAAHPGRKINIDARGALTGEWDCERISQVLSNLVVNAIEHGGEATVVNVKVQGKADVVAVAPGAETVQTDEVKLRQVVVNLVENATKYAPEGRIDGIFNAMKRTGGEGGNAALGPSGNLGLGLYIASEIVHAHNGTIEVDSSNERGTTFKVQLPRTA